MKHGLTDDVYKKIKDIIKDNNQHKIVLFGSRARGDYKKTSDIDLAVLDKMTRDEQYELMNKFDLLDIVYKIDIVFVDNNTKQELLQSIKREGIEF